MTPFKFPTVECLVGFVAYVAGLFSPDVATLLSKVFTPMG